LHIIVGFLNLLSLALSSRRGEMKVPTMKCDEYKIKD